MLSYLIIFFKNGFGVLRKIPSLFLPALFPPKALIYINSCEGNKNRKTNLLNCSKSHKEQQTQEVFDPQNEYSTVAS